MFLASARLQPKPSYARSAQMCPGFAMLPPLHPGWDSVLRIRSVVARCSIPRVAASGAALPRRYAWPPTRCITPKTISASSFGVSLASSANPKPSPPPLINSLGFVYHLLSTKEAYNETVFHRCDEEA